MRAKNLICVGVLAGTLALTEIAEGTDWVKGTEYHPDATLNGPALPGIPENPHTHLEAEGEFYYVSSALSASGAQYASYELTLEPRFAVNDDGENVLAWIDATGFPDAVSGQQRLYARFPNQDELANALAKLPAYLPAKCVESICESVLKGPTKVGGSSPSIRFLFSEPQLIDLGMSPR